MASVGCGARCVRRSCVRLFIGSACQDNAKFKSKLWARWLRPLRSLLRLFRLFRLCKPPVLRRPSRTGSHDQPTFRDQHPPPLSTPSTRPTLSSQTRFQGLLRLHLPHLPHPEQIDRCPRQAKRVHRPGFGPASACTASPTEPVRRSAITQIVSLVAYDIDCRRD